MKKCKSILALLLIVALVAMLFAACSNSTSDSSSTSTSDATEATDTNTTDAAEDAEATEDEEVVEEVEDEEMANINMYMFDLRMTGADYGQHVIDAVNELTEAKINTHVNITYFVIGDWLTKVQLAISGGESIDVLPLAAGNTISQLYPKSMVMDITDYLNEYAPETVELMSDYLNAYTYNGRIYGLPTMRNFASNNYVIMRGDILDELGLREKAENLSSWSELEEILAAVNEAYAGTGMYPISKGAGSSIISSNGAVKGGDSFADEIVWDILGDSLNLIRSDNEGHVMSYPGSAETQAEMAYVAQWYDNGWVYPDSVLTDTHGDELMKQGVAFATVQVSEYGVETVKSASCGFEVVCPIINSGIIKTSTLQAWGIGVASTADEPEAACKFLNLLYTDPELMNLLIWGVEGVDYEIVDDQVQQPESGYYYEADFLIGNNLLLTPLYGNGADYYEVCKELIDKAEKSVYMGFVFDTSELEAVIGQLTAVNDQYSRTLYCGEYTEELYQEYLAKLDGAGLNDYLDAAQQQLDAWMAAQ